MAAAIRAYGSAGADGPTTFAANISPTTASATSANSASLESKYV
ncbi:hypothetical protein ACFSTC_17275 [Nonomuraea ferruginea]